MNLNFDKFKTIFNLVEPLAKPFVPGAAGSILDKVNAGLNGASPASASAIQQLATEYDQMEQALLAMATVVADLKARVEKLEAK